MAESLTLTDSVFRKIMKNKIIKGITLNPNQTQINNARNKYGIPYQDTIFLLIDDTAFGSAKDGFAITSSGIYWHNIFGLDCPKNGIRWETLPIFHISVSDKEVHIDVYSIKNDIAKYDPHQLKSLLLSIISALEDDTSSTQVVEKIDNHNFESIREIVKSLIPRFAGMNILFGVSQEQKATVHTYYRVPKNLDVIALVDATVFGSAKKGLAITEYGIFWTGENDILGKISWEDYEPAGIQIKMFGNIHFNFGPVFDMSGASAKAADVVGLLNEIKRLYDANKDYFTNNVEDSSNTEKDLDDYEDDQFEDDYEEDDDEDDDEDDNFEYDDEGDIVGLSKDKARHYIQTYLDKNNKDVDDVNLFYLLYNFIRSLNRNFDISRVNKRNFERYLDEGNIHLFYASEILSEALNIKNHPLLDGKDEIKSFLSSTFSTLLIIYLEYCCCKYIQKKIMDKNSLDMMDFIGRSAFVHSIYKNFLLEPIVGSTDSEIKVSDFLSDNKTICFKEVIGGYELDINKWSDMLVKDFEDFVIAPNYEDTLFLRHFLEQYKTYMLKTMRDIILPIFS